MADEGTEKAKNSRIKRVLLVEDDPVLALDLEAALIEGGVAEVVICSSMEATMAQLEAERPDALILDTHLSDRDDGWALAELASLLGPKKPRIIFATGAADEIPDSVKQMGCIFEKPYDPAHLVEVLLSDRKTGLFSRIRGALG